VLILLIVILALAAAFSAVEAALAVLGREWIDAQAEKGAWGAMLVRGMNRTAGAVARAGMVGNALFAAVAAVACSFWIADGPVGGGVPGRLLALAGSVLGYLVLGSLGPRAIALRYPENVARWGLLPLGGFFRLFWWISTSIGWCLGPLVKLLAGGRKEVHPVMTEEEIKRIIDEGSEAGVLAREEREMLHSVIEFNDSVAREVMVPRLDIVALEVGASSAEIVRVALEEGYTRVPVYKGTLDNIAGIVHVKDLLRVWEHRDLIVLYDIMRRPHFIPETKKLSELLREFRTKNLHMAIVVDEFGATEGLVTLEDILEEIVGEIQDEHDMETPHITRVRDEEFLVEARMNLEDFGKAVGLELPETEMDTVGGFVIDLFGHIPRRGERVEYGDWRFEALEVHKSRLLKVRFERRAGARPKRAEAAS
jgi:putative hemolysin